MSLGARYHKLLAASTVSNLGDGVGIIAYPWLASAVTRNPGLIALVAVAQRLPWLVFTLPAGVITDRVDRKRAMVSMDVLRAGVTAVVAFGVLARQGTLPSPDELDSVVSTAPLLYVLVVVATLLLGAAEVLRDNSAQTFLPSIVARDDLEKANGRLWSAELVANSFAGPALGSALLVAAFSLPFFVDAASFAVAAALVAAIPGSFRVERPRDHVPAPWRTEAAEGFRWLWHNELLRTMAIVLGVMNGLGMATLATFVLFSQEVLGTSTTEFALLSTGAAAGGVIGGVVASGVSARLGTGPSLWLTLVGGALVFLGVGLASRWPVVWVLTAVEVLVGTLWNVITVSFRQSIIPARLLGRVNSVYRFFGWGMMPIGSALGGLIVLVCESMWSREVALRMPWLVCGVAQLVLFAYAGPRLTTSRMDAARRVVAGEAQPAPGPAA